jgi:hypothetical protein
LAILCHDSNSDRKAGFYPGHIAPDGLKAALQNIDERHRSAASRSICDFAISRKAVKQFKKTATGRSLVGAIYRFGTNYP